MKKILVIFLSLFLFTPLLMAQNKDFPVRYDKIQNPYTDMTSLYTGIPKYIKGTAEFENFPRSNDADLVFKAEGIPFGKIKLVAPFPLFVYKSSNGLNEAALLLGGNTWLVYRRWF